MSDYVLVHHGIKGQKWGVRRFQNEDGSYTSLGKKRYAGNVGDITRERLNKFKNSRSDDDDSSESSSGGSRRFHETLKAGKKNRYQNEDGTLTEEGERRYEKEVRRNKQKPKKNRADEDSLRDPDKWIEDDMRTTRDVIDASGRITKEASSIERSMRSNKSNPRLDLTTYSDKQLREAIQRELLERQYNEVFNQPTISKGRESVSKFLDTAGKVLSIGSGIVTLAMGIQKLRKD